MKQKHNPQKKKLVIATDCFLPRWDGISRFLIEIIPSLTKIWDIYIIAPDFKGRSIELENVHIIKIPLSKLKIADFHFAKNNSQIVDETIQIADLVWTQTTSHIGRNAINAAKKYKIPVVHFIHSIDHELVAKSINTHSALQDSVYFIAKKYIMNLYNKCDVLISPSKNVCDMLEWNEVKTPKVTVKLGVNLKKFKSPKSKTKAKEAIGINPDAQVIGFCGRLAEEKNLSTLFEAFKKIKGEFPKTLLLIVGKGLKKFEKKLEQNPRIIYVGEKDDVVPYLQAMDIFVLPSLVETTSLATLEAMACEAVPVVTPIGYVKEYVREKVNGLQFPLRNSTILSLKIKWLLKEDFVKRQLAKAARLTIQRNFNFLETEEEIKKILENCASLKEDQSNLSL